MKVDKLNYIRPVREVVGRDFDLAVVNRLVPDHRFVGIIDRGLRKHEPDATIPWEDEAGPQWSRGLEPRSLLDVGCGLGAFTTAALRRLEDWGCLGRLEKITLVEKEARLKKGGASALRASLQRRVASTIGPRGRSIQIQAIVKPLRLPSSSPGEAPARPLGASRYDVIVASHISYYFGDGSGRDLIENLAAQHLNENGIIWLVIRRKASPIYEMRARTLAAFGLRDAKPYDYAEYFQTQVLPTLGTVRCLAWADKEYLSAVCPLSDTLRTRLTHLLMWRQEPTRGAHDPLYHAASTCTAQRGPLFSERHFILGRR